MKTYTIIGGVNGAGKSSLTGVLKSRMNDLGIIVDKMSIGKSPVEGGKEAIDDCLDKGVNFTQETTLSGHRTERTVRRAKEQGYYIRLFYVGLDTVNESLKRILPYCDEAVFYDNDNGFVEVAVYRNGEIIPTVENRPQWLQELLNGSQ